MEKYEVLDLEIIAFASADIVTSSDDTILPPITAGHEEMTGVGDSRFTF